MESQDNEKTRLLQRRACRRHGSEDGDGSPNSVPANPCDLSTEQDHNCEARSDSDDRSDNGTNQTSQILSSGNGHAARLSQSWNGFQHERTSPGPAEKYSMSTTSKPGPRVSVGDGSFGHPLGGPNLDVKKDDGAGDFDESRQWRLQRRLMVSVFTALVFYVTAYLSLALLQSQYLFRRFAVDQFNLSNIPRHQVPCGDGQNNSLQDDINEIQAKTSQQMLNLEFVQFIPAIFTALFVGSYTDYLGRKYLVIVPMIGACVKALMYVLVVYLNLDVNYLFVGYATEGFLGSFYSVQLGLSASIADVTTSSRQRVLLFAVLAICMAVSGCISQIGTGYLIDGLGFEVPCLIICCLFFLASVCLLILMPETVRRPDHLVLNPCVHLRKVFGFYTVDGTVQQRLLFICGLVIFFFITLINLGKIPVETLYVMNSPFCWNPIKIGFFTGLRLLLQNTAAVLSLKVLSKWMRIELIGMLALVSGITAFTIEALADSDLMMYLSVLAGIIMTMTEPVVRTLLSRMASSESQGALFASVSAVETVCHLAATIVYNKVYTATLDTFRGAVFLLMVSFLLLDAGLLIVFTIASRKIDYFPDAQREIKIDASSSDAGSSILTPSPSSTVYSCDEEEETRPLLMVVTDTGPHNRTQQV